MGRWCAMLLLACIAAGAPKASEPASGASMVVDYHLPTDMFNALDNLSDWLPGYTSPEYREYWQQHFGLDDDDRAALAAYAAFRRRTSELAEDTRSGVDAVPADIFAPATTRTPEAFSRHFLDASSFESGVAAAIAAQAPGDRAMLRAYYARFAPRARRLVDAALRFRTQRKALEGQLAAEPVQRLAEAIRAFYAVAPAPEFTARFVWWPDPDSTRAKVRGRYILLHSQHDAADGTAPPMNWAPIVLHEYAHYLSAGQPAVRKQALTAAFLQRCPAAAELPNPLNALEEPLAVYWGQYRFEHAVRGRELAPDEDWYFKPLADRAAKALARAFPATGPAPSLDDPAVLAAAASACPAPDVAAGTRPSAPPAD